jgi:hypothetical protein
MKKTLLAALLFLPAPAFAGTIPAEDAPDHHGQTVTVVGRASVQRMPSGEIYLDLDGKGDAAPISAYVSRGNAGPFWDIARLNGKWVAVSGEIGTFRSRPEIVLTRPSQIAVVVEPPAKREASIQPLRIHIPPAPRR